MNIRLTQSAEDDIRSIAETGIEMFGASQAQAYHNALYAVFDLLTGNPGMGRERTEFNPPVRVHPFRSHIILYQIEDQDILIIRVRHAHEDWITDPT